MLKIEIKLDKSFQKLRKNQMCHYCFKNATEIHHIVRRANKAFRWDKRNALPVCRCCHTEIHSNELEEPEIDFEVVSFKVFKMNRCLSDREFFEEKAKEYGIKYTDKDFEIVKKPKKRTSKKSLQVAKKILTPKHIANKEEQKKLAREYAKKKYKYLKSLIKGNK